MGPTIDFDIENRIEIPTFNKNDEVVPPQIHYNAGYNPFENSKGKGVSSQATFRSRMSDNTNWQKLYGAFESGKPATTEPAEPVQHQLPIDDSATTSTGRFFQLKGKYILTSVKSGLMVIDQHRAHERILFEKMLQRNTDTDASQRLLYPIRIDLNLKDTDLFRQMVPELEKLGFEINELGGNSFSFSAVPSNFPESDLKDWVNSMLMLTGEEHISITESMTESIAKSLASQMAIGYGRQLSQDEMADMNARLFACKMPNYTPSGRPIVAIIGTDDIDKLFK